MLVLPRLPQAERRVVVESWCRKLLNLAGVTLEATGQAAPGPVMLVSNHVSWLDMIAIQALCSCRFVAKSEVRKWPLIGSIATRLGTIYIERHNSRSAAKVTGEIASLLHAGETIVIFPEGTTTDGSTLQPFRASLLQAAIMARTSVQPAALSYVEGGTGLPCRRASYSGSDGLTESIWRTISSPVTVRVSFGATTRAEGQQRRCLAVSLRAGVEALRASATSMTMQ